MATYAIGDIQGCYDEFRRLLDRLEYNPDKDRLWLAGDLVNRGPNSLMVLRFVHSLGDRAVTVLGNHDLHLLALSQSNQKYDADEGLKGILKAPDRDELLDWLRHQPLLHHSPKKRFSLLHAGLAPQWSLNQAIGLAREVEAVLQGDGFADLMRHMYGNRPRRWKDSLKGMDRLRFIINALTRVRYCTRRGDLALNEKGQPGTQGKNILPWFDVPGRASAEDRIICGHWSTLGYVQRNNIWALDTGCLWGGSLTAVRVRKTKPPRPLQIDCKGSMHPGQA